MDYKIEVITTPHTHDNATKPYFWCVLQSDEFESDSWNVCWHGWEATIPEAWNTALEYYNTYIKEAVQ